MSEQLQWETGTAFEKFPLGTTLRLVLTHRCGFLWLKKKIIIVSATVVAQDVEIVKRVIDGLAQPFFHSFVEVCYCIDGIQQTRKYSLLFLEKMLKNGSAEILVIPSSEMIYVDDQNIFVELEIGDFIRAFKKGAYIEGHIADIIGNNLYEVFNSHDKTTHLNISLKDLIWYRRISSAS